MRAVKCDRCGAYYTSYGSRSKLSEKGTGANGMRFVYVSNDLTYNSVVTDLCEPCLRALCSWVKMKGGDPPDA